MRTDDQLFNASQYWMGVIQNELSIYVKKYMDQNELTPSQLAKELGVTKSVVAQVLKGKFNYSLGKLIDLALAVGVIPHIKFNPLDEYLLQQQQKGSKRQVRLTVNQFLPVKAGKTKVPLHRDQNGIAVSLDVNQVNIITPSDKKIA